MAKALTAQQIIRKQCLERVLALQFQEGNEPTCTQMVQVAGMFARFIFDGTVPAKFPWSEQS